MKPSHTLTPIHDECEEPDHSIPKHETDLSLILRKRLEGLDHEIHEFNNIMTHYSLAVDQDLLNLSSNMGKLQKNLNRVHMKKVGEDDNGQSTMPQLGTETQQSSSMGNNKLSTNGA